MFTSYSSIYIFEKKCIKFYLHGIFKVYKVIGSYLVKVKLLNPLFISKNEFLQDSAVIL